MWWSIPQRQQSNLKPGVFDWSIKGSKSLESIEFYEAVCNNVPARWICEKRIKEIQESTSRPMTHLSTSAWQFMMSAAYSFAWSVVFALHSRIVSKVGIMGEQLEHFTSWVHPIILSNANSGLLSWRSKWYDNGPRSFILRNQANSRT